MKVVIINGTNRVGNKSMVISKLAEKMLYKFCEQVNLVDLNNFDKLFRGEYINLNNASDEQKLDLANIQNSDLIVFVIPTYHHGIPSPLKNFIDSVSWRDLLSDKKIGLIAASGNSESVIQTEEILFGVLAFTNQKSVILPKKAILDCENVDAERLEKFLEYCVEF